MSSLVNELSVTLFVEQPWLHRICEKYTSNQDTRMNDLVKYFRMVFILIRTHIKEDEYQELHQKGHKARTMFGYYISWFKAITNRGSTRNFISV